MPAYRPEAKNQSGFLRRLRPSEPGFRVAAPTPGSGNSVPLSVERSVPGTEPACKETPAQVAPQSGRRVPLIPTARLNPHSVGRSPAVLPGDLLSDLSRMNAISYLGCDSVG